MSSVSASFPGINYNRRTVRSEINPLDKSTIVSIYPKAIHETKHTIQPGVFDIPAGSFEKPALLVVGSSSWWRELSDDEPLLEIPNSSIQVAKSIVVDYCNGLLECNMSDAMPGLFYIPGEIVITELLTKYKNKLMEAQTNQKRWFSALVSMADSLWSRSNGNPLTISDDMRMAARDLGLNTKEWLQDFQYQEMVRCVACGSMRNPLFPVCPTCKAVVDVEKAKKMNIEFAK